MHTRDKWDLRFMEEAKAKSLWSKDPSTKIGCVIVQGRKIKATGYNGFPPGIVDTEYRLNHRETKYALVVHGEMNAIIQAGHSCEGATLYLYGMPGPPCANCTKHLITAGIRRVVSRSGEWPSRWAEDFERSIGMMAEAGVDYEAIDFP